jgi:hypothetical protein
MRTALIALVVAAALVPASSSAITLPDVVTLSKAGMSDALLIALIEREAPPDPIDAQEVLALREQGVTEPVLLALLKQPPAPAVIVVGHDPDSPAPARPAPPAGAAPGAPVMAGIVVPYFVALPSTLAIADGRHCVAVLPVMPPPHVLPPENLAATPNVGHIAVSGVGHIAVSGVGHIWTPSTSTPAAAAACVPAAPRPRVRPRR